MTNTFLINGHEPYPFSKGELNKTFVETAKETLESMGHNVKYVAITEPYDVESTVETFFWADNIIYQTPVFWFGIPGAFKTFIDNVFNTGLTRFIQMDPSIEYGTGGLLTNKRYMLSTTWNAPKSFFNNQNGKLLKDKNLDDIFLPFHLSNRYIGLNQLPSFATYDIYHNPSIMEDIEKYKSHLQQHFIN
ncbi:NAD(P)H-dependent oxidoreductase [Flagellimonas lutimaris]|uniref:NAD(P)H-dependent oxidoreductase n=1 Tax=Flagellimonas lutimaris TaxID=475082 RepID=UPI003F5CF81C